VQTVQANLSGPPTPGGGASPVLAEWRAGWPLVAITAVALTCAPTTLPIYTLGVFVVPLQAEFGWGRGQIEMALLFSTGLSALFSPIMGELVQRYGTRRTILPGLAGIACAFLIASQISDALWQFLGAYALMALLGAGVSAVACTRLITGAFEASRGLALGIALSGTGLCAAIMPWIATLALELYGWRGAYVVLAAVAALMVLPLAFFLLPREGMATETIAAYTKGLTVREAVRTPRFWLLGTSIALAYLAIGGLIPNIVPALTDRGIGATVAAGVMSGFGLAIVAGRVAVGFLLDRFWAPAVSAAIMVPAALACLIFTLPAGIGTWSIAALVLGLATGMEFDVLAFLVARYFGLRDYARIYGWLYIFLAGAAGVAPMLFGLLHDATGSYTLAFQASAAVLVAAALMLLLLGRYPAGFPARDDEPALLDMEVTA
jgi:MFS family permease